MKLDHWSHQRGGQIFNHIPIGGRASARAQWEDSNTFFFGGGYASLFLSPAKTFVSALGDSANKLHILGEYGDSLRMYSCTTQSAADNKAK